MNGYAHARGRTLNLPLPDKPEPERKPPPPLSSAEQARVAQNRRLVHEHMPEMLPIIKELVEEGLIDGWRNVTKVTIFPTQEAQP